MWLFDFNLYLGVREILSDRPDQHTCVTTFLGPFPSSYFSVFKSQHDDFTLASSVCYSLSSVCKSQYMTVLHWLPVYDGFTLASSVCYSLSIIFSLSTQRSGRTNDTGEFYNLVGMSRKNMVREEHRIPKIEG